MIEENQMDDLMQIAIEAGLIGKEPNGFDRVKLTKAEVHFAQLVAKKAVEAAKAEEREACAALVEGYIVPGIAREMARVIRARANT